MTVECNAIPSPANVTADDTCDDDVAVVYSEQIIPGTCKDNFTLIRTWTAADDCGNNTSASQTIVVEDTTPPVLVGVPADVTADCDGGSVPPIPVVTASDNCDIDVVVTFSEQLVEGVCEGSFTLTRRWIATDNCGNTSVDEQVIHGGDASPPVLVGVPSNITVECDAIPAAANVTADDACDDDVAVIYSEQIIPGTCKDNFTLIRTWTAADDCGNNTSASQTIVVEDSTPPVLVGVPGDVTADCDGGSVPPIPVVTATDNCDTDVVVTFSEELVEGLCEGSFTLTRRWIASDNCGNTVIGEQIIYGGDAVPPALVGVPVDITVECNDIPVPPVVVAEDVCDDNVLVTVTEVIIPGLCVDNYDLIRTWTAEDDCGNQISASQIIKVIDTTAPELIPVNPDLVGIENGDTITIGCKLLDVFELEDFVGSDNCDSNVTITFDESKMEGDCLSDGYFVKLTCTWTAEDNCGNTNTFTVYVLVTDTLSPVFVNAPTSITLECTDSIPSSAGVTVTDNCDDEVPIMFDEVIQPGVCPQAYTITRTWRATDECGNAAVHTQVITIEDSAAPVISNVPADVTINLSNGEVVPGIPGDVEATDNCDPTASLNFMEEVINESCGYVIIRTWTAEDNCGNMAIQSQKITVIDGFAAYLNVVNETCDDKGSIEAVITMGTPPIVYSWDDNTIPTSQNLRTGLEAGTYSLTVSDANGCSKVFDPIIILDECECLEPEVDTVMLTQPSCLGGDGMIEILLVKDQDKYTFSWTPNVSSTNKATNLNSGAYEVRITYTGKPDCFIKLTFNLFNPDAPVVIVDSLANETCEGNDGVAVLTPATLQYVWSDGGAGATRTDLSAGVYSVTATDKVSGCKTEVTVSIGLDSSLVAEALVNALPSCSESNGSVTIQVTGGSGTYAFSWGPNATKDSLAAGNYSVTVTDLESGCETIVIFELGEDVKGVEIEAEEELTLDCFGNKNGTLVFTITEDQGFAGPAVIRFYDAIGFEVQNGALGAGEYCLKVFDANGCLAGIHCFKVISPDKLEMEAIVVAAGCDTLGTIDLIVSGGTSPYNYDWSHLMGSNDPSELIDLGPGVYSVTLTDANGCSLVADSLLVEDNCDPCPPSLDSLTIVITDCNEPGELCLEIPLNEYHQYTVLWDGEVYDGPIDGCQFDSVMAYTYYTLLGFGQAGPYELVSWTVNNQTYSGIFPDVDALVDSMNLWDPTGNWDQIPSQLLIVGGDFSNSYSKMWIKQLAFPNSYAEIGFNVGVVSTTTQLLLPEGTHEIIIYEPNALCGDTLIVTVVCQPDTQCTNIDTIYASVIVTESIEVCVELEACMDAVVTTFESCNGDLSGQTQLGAWALDASTGCMLYTAGDYPGVDTLCVIACDSIAGICDTTYIIITCEPKPSCPSLDTIHVVVEVTNTVVSCIELESCMTPVHTTYQSCTGLLSGATLFGTWSLDPQTGCVTYVAGTTIGADTLCVVACDTIVGVCDTTIIVIQITPNCPDIVVPTHVNLHAEDCNGQGLYCLDIPLNQIAQYAFTDNGVPFSGIVDGCAFDSLYGYNYSLIPGGGNAGPYKLDEWSINGTPFSGQFQTLNDLLDLMNAFDPAGNWAVDMAIVNIIGGDKVSTYGPLRITQTNTFIKATINLNDLLMPQGTLISVDTGVHVLVMTDIITGCTDTITLNVNCEDCPDIYAGADTLFVTDCAELAKLCLDMDIMNLQDYSFLDNNLPYTGSFFGCDFDSLQAYNYTSVINAAPQGPYTIVWTINGLSYTGEVQTMEELVDSMNVWDNTGNWVIDLAMNMIRGGDASNNYGVILVSLVSQPGVPVAGLQPNLQPLPNGVALELGTGNHSITVTNNLNGCTYNIDVVVSCEEGPGEPGDVIEKFVYYGDTDTLCLDTTGLGTIIGFSNICPDKSNGNASIQYIAETACILYTGDLLGSDTFCIVICGTAGCDTTEVIIHVIPKTDTLHQEILIGFSDVICIDTEVPGVIDSVYNICASASGQYADIAILSGTNCLEYTGEAIGTDTACIVICDDLGNCDTTILIVHVVPPTADTVVFILDIDQDSVHCLDLSELSGTVLSITDICAGPETSVDFNIVDSTACITFTAIQEGSDTACIVFCDAITCDTVIIIVHVVPGGNVQQPPVAVDDSTMVMENRTVVIQVLNNDTLNGVLVDRGIIVSPTNGTVTLTSQGHYLYTPNAGFCGGIDSFDYYIANAVGVDTARVFITVNCRKITIYTGLSPNGDLVNDVFIIDGIDEFPENEVIIFNRWGNQVFYMKGYSNDKAWDGRWEGKDLPDGTYFYLVRDGEGETYSGYVQIHR
ncbi:MAG: gliding motility-associated C-terminal domain-containing protein [Saprospiraceae bacterium]|nr:gliding motility-associated C-terminal domain-containing protein [Saprospiraceae bacterium]